MNKFLERHKLLKLTQEEIQKLNRPSISKRLNQQFLKVFNPSSVEFTVEFYQNLKKN
jgi:hypothetical protein